MSTGLIIRSCKSCQQDSFIYAHDLCRDCYYKFYMRQWRTKQRIKKLSYQMMPAKQKNLSNLLDDQTYTEYMNCIRTIQTKVLDDEELKSYINRAADILYTHTQLRGEALVYRLLSDLKIFKLFTITKLLDPKYWRENDDNDNDNDDNDDDNKEQEQGGQNNATIGLLIAFDIYRIIHKLHKIKLSIAKSVDRVCSSSSGSSGSNSSSSDSSSSVEGEGRKEEEAKEIALRHVQNIAKRCEEILDILDEVDNRVKLDTLELILIKILSIAVSYRQIAKLTSLSSKWVSYLLDAIDHYYSYNYNNYNSNNNNNNNNNNNAAGKGIIDNIDIDNENKHLPKAVAYARVIRLLNEGFFIEFERDIKAGEKVDIIPYILREAKRREHMWMET